MLFARATLLAALYAVGTLGFAQDLIIESRPEGKNHDKYSEPIGRWLDSNTPAQTAKSAAEGLTPQGEAGSRKLTVPAVRSEDPKEILGSARFAPGFTEAGHYHVYVTFPKAANVTPANYVIKHATGEETRSIAQDGWGAVRTPNAGIWIYLGEYDFAAGPDQYVELQVTGVAGPADGRTSAQAMADGIRFAKEPLKDFMKAQPAATPATLIATPAAPVGGTAAPIAPAPAQAPDSGPLAWDDNIQAAQGEAAKANKKIFVFFYSPENERSRNYDGKVFQNARVKQLLKSKFILVRINIDENRSLASNLQVFRAGTINLYDHEGNGLAQYTETLDAEELANRLDRI